jgi:hypothetical protein
MIFHTKSGSIYEVDDELSLFRRIAREQGDLRRFDYSWRRFSERLPVKKGFSALFFYGIDDYVRTSAVTEVLDSDQ